jgi:hypothetical protein
MLEFSTTSKRLEEEMKIAMAAPRPLPYLKDRTPEELYNTQTEILRYIKTTAAGKLLFKCTLKDDLKSYILDAIKRTLAITSVHEHKFAHHASCFKKGKQHGCKYMFCRYDFPKEVAPFTAIGKDPSYCHECATPEEGLSQIQR